MGLNDAFPISPMPTTEMTPALIDAIRRRVSDGIFLGGNYNDAYEEYLVAHRDRCALLAFVDKLRGAQ